MWKDGSDDRLLSFIAGELDEPCMVVSFVVVANIQKIDGDLDIAFNAAPEQRATDTLGLLRAATAIEEEGLRRSWFGEE